MKENIGEYIYSLNMRANSQNITQKCENIGTDRFCP